MVDFVKIRCEGLNISKWTDNVNLDFIGNVSFTTGEALDNPIVATYKGLKFKIIPSGKVKGEFYYYLEGSLHKFFNDGVSNADNFDLDNIRKTVNTLYKEFGVNPATSYLENLEFGLNLPVSIGAKPFINSVRCLPDTRLASLNVDRVKLGKVCARNHYKLKIYDKQLQETGKTGNVVRMEMKVQKMRFFQRRNIEVATLFDLGRLDVVEKLGKVLCKGFGQVIFYDGSIDRKKLSVKERDKLADFKDYEFWENLDRNNRYKQLKNYAKFLDKYGANEVQKKAVSDLAILWQKLSAKSTVKYESGADKKATMSPLEWRVTLSPNRDKKDSFIFLPKSPKNGLPIAPDSDPKIDPKKCVSFLPKNSPKNPPKKCCSCGRDISHQRSISKYCSTKYFGPYARRCRDAGFVKARRERRKAAREKETRDLVAAVALLGLVDIRLLIFWNDGNQLVATAAALDAMPRPLRSVVRVELSADGLAVVLTTRRAKELIKAVLAVSDDGE